MKTQRQFLSVAWLAACTLLLLSACRGPAPIAGGVTEITAAGVTSNPPLLASTPLPSGAVPTRVVVTEQTLTPTVLVPPTRQSTPRSADATATPAASVTNTPDTPTPSATDTPVPDETPVPSPTPEIIAPVIEGLSLKSDGKGGMQYVAEKGNPYGVAVGEVVGRASSVQVKGLGNTRVRNPDGTFEEVGFVRQSAVVISNPKVLAYFTNKENTPDKVRAGEWKIALPFEPGSETKIWELTFPDYIGNQSYIAISGLPKNNVIVNPFSQSALVRSYPQQKGVFSVVLFLPNSIAPEIGINYSLGIMYSRAARVFVDNTGKNMSPGASLIENISGQVSDMWATNAQAVFAVGSLKGTKDFAIARHVLTLGDSFVFAGAK